MSTQLDPGTSSRRSSRRRRGSVVAVVAALALLVAACGDDDDGGGPASIDEEATDDNGSDNGNGGGDNSGDDNGGDAGTDPFDAALRYAECMREHGIDMPDPQPQENGEFSIDLSPPEGMSEEELRAAEADCGPLLEEGRTEQEPLSPDELAERRDQAVALAECMRDRGHDYPDPVVGEDGGVQQQVPPGLGPGAPGFEQFEEDLADCMEEAGLEAPGEGGTTSESGGDDGGAET
jgi:hypothetical protein